MISQLKGILEEKHLSRVLLDVNGVGYDVAIPLSTYDRLPKEGDAITLKTILNVREDAMTLFGFHTPLERDLFYVGATRATQRLVVLAHESLRERLTV